MSDMEHFSDSEDHVDIDGTSDDEYSDSEKLSSQARSPACTDCGVIKSTKHTGKPSFLITDILSDRKSQNKDDSCCDKSSSNDYSDTEETDEFKPQRYGNFYIQFVNLGKSLKRHSFH